MIVSFGNVVQVSNEIIEFMCKTVIESGLLCICGSKADLKFKSPLFLQMGFIPQAKGADTQPYWWRGAPPPVFSLHTGFKYRIWRTYGLLIHAFPALQAKLLEHPRVKAFVSHGGANSLKEAVKTCTPVFVTPVYDL